MPDENVTANQSNSTTGQSPLPQSDQAGTGAGGVSENSSTASNGAPAADTDSSLTASPTPAPTAPTAGATDSQTDAGSAAASSEGNDTAVGAALGQSPQNTAPSAEQSASAEGESLPNLSPASVTTAGTPATTTVAAGSTDGDVETHQLVGFGKLIAVGDRIGVEIKLQVLEDIEAACGALVKRAEQIGANVNGEIAEIRETHKI